MPEITNSTIYAGQGKMINHKRTPHGVGIEVKSKKKNGIPHYRWTLGTFE